jgi:deoxyinosine 3'endonuclease (endonuclease V)
MPIKDWTVLYASDTLQRHEGLDGAEEGFFASLQTLLHARAKSMPKKISRICAVDASYRSNRVAAVATEAVDGRVVERSVYAGHFSFPYVAGLLYLHEGPFATEAVNKLKVRPELVCFDAHGAAHPRSAGLATICGMILGIPSIGIAKSILVGKVEAGDEAIHRLTYNETVVGFATGKSKMRYWSPGCSVTLGDLKMLMQEHGLLCLELMKESHRLAKQKVSQPSFLLTERAQRKYANKIQAISILH